MLDAACDGNAVDAMKQLERLIYSGEHPIAVLGQIAFPLRKFALATSIYRAAEKERRRISLSAALERAGGPAVLPFRCRTKVEKVGSRSGSRVVPLVA